MCLAALPENGAVSPQEEEALGSFAVQSAKEGGVSYLHDSSNAEPSREVDSPLREFREVLNSAAVIQVFRDITGISDLAHASLEARRFRAGHFMTFHHGTQSSDDTGKRRASFSLNLTPEWKPEWGGMLEFRGIADANLVEAIVPSFNCLDVFPFPRGHWVSLVSGFVDCPIYALVGGLYRY
jgi:Rps23 Pro-64 3,4-dihydroxylase Tpa1-like proline 4-hydroxylase